MIKFVIKENSFVIDSGSLIGGDLLEQRFFDVISREPLSPSEGPTDLALANRMNGGPLKASQIIFEEYPEEQDNQVH